MNKKLVYYTKKKRKRMILKKPPGDGFKGKKPGAGAESRQDWRIKSISETSLKGGVPKYDPEADARSTKVRRDGRKVGQHCLEKQV